MKRTLGTIFFSTLLLLTLSGCLRGRLQDRLSGGRSDATQPVSVGTATAPSTPGADSFWQEWDALANEADSWLAPEPTVAAGDLP